MRVRSSAEGSWRHGLLTAGTAMAIALGVASCSDVQSRLQGSDEPETHMIKGTVTLTNQITGFRTDFEPCLGNHTRGLDDDDIQGGATVEITNEANTVVGVGTLTDGESGPPVLQGSPRTWTCSFTF